MTQVERCCRPRAALDLARAEALFAQGHSLRAVARALGVSHETVRVHVKKTQPEARRQVRVDAGG
jgi:DNA-binding CsgD family transcriptional regulator